jgi:hypothetical protein
MRALILAFALLNASPAVAWDSWFSESQPSYSVDGYEYRLRRSGYRPRQYQYRQRRYRPEYYYTAPKHTHSHTSSSDYGSSATCYASIRVVGIQWKDEAGAEDKAREAWMARARWQYGEIAMDIGNAKGYVKRCSRSSIGEIDLPGKILDATFHRCEVEAKPCRPKFEDGK